MNYILVSTLAFLISLFTVPRIIYIAKKKRLFDLPDNNRKIHKKVIPNLGGVAIFFASMIIANFFISPSDSANWWHYLVASSLILFIIGIKDDILVLTPAKKFLTQIITSVIIVVFADIRLQSFHGILGLNELPYWFSVVFSVVGIIFITNAFNLIDGIDGLAGSISVFCTLSLGVLLALVGNYSAACLAFSLMGAIVGFLYYNRSPASIFMGDSGALFIGFVVSVLSILFINAFPAHPPQGLLGTVIHSPQAALLVALSILFVPVFDSFRVFFVRIINGKHPFSADRIHLHHYLLDLGFSHNRVVGTLAVANFLIISVALFIQDLNPNIAIITILVFSFGLYTFLYFRRKIRLDKIENDFEEMKRNNKIFIPSAKEKEEKLSIPTAVLNH